MPQAKRSLGVHVSFWGAICLIGLLIACVQVDRGGDIATRERQIHDFANTLVEIEGTCLSACTLQLGARNVCVHRSARFGFHGPSIAGKPLAPQEFERWSSRMATYYREPLRSKFMQSWRHDISGHHRVTGAELIAIGYPEC